MGEAMTPEQLNEFLARIQRGELKWVGQDSPEVAAAEQNTGDSGSWNPYGNMFTIADPTLADAVGYTGPATSLQRDENTGTTESISPEFTNWLSSQGYKPVTTFADDGFAYTGLMKDGQVNPQTIRRTEQGDKAFQLAALAAMGITGANIMAAQGLLGGGAAAGGSGAAGSGQLVNGAFLGEGVASGIPAWDAAAGLGAAGGAGSGAFLGEGVSSGVPAWDAAAGMGPATTAGTTAATTAATSGTTAATSGLLGSGGLSDLIKPALTIAGAVAGSQGTGPQTTTQQSKTDPRIDPYIYGDSGFLKAASDWYQANKSGVNPTMQQGWDRQMGLLTDPNIQSQMESMRGNAYGMLSKPMAGNGFDRFFGGR